MCNADTMFMRRVDRRGDRNESTGGHQVHRIDRMLDGRIRLPRLYLLPVLPSQTSALTV